MVTNIKISDISYEGIRENLKDFLRGQDIFKDYNFEGSNLSIILDVLAYNTYYDSFHANMLANEIFIDSAKLRENVVNIAKHLDYIPTSIRSAKAAIQVKGTGTLIPRDTYFYTSINGRSFSFTVEEEIQLTNTYQLISIIEGIGNTTTFINDYTDTDTKFELPQANIDLTSLIVTVRDSIDDTAQEVYNLADDINGITGESLVYWLQESIDGKYEIYFGDNVLGKRPGHGSIIEVSFLLSKGPAANGAKIFTGPSGVDIVRPADIPAAGGTNAQDIDSVRFHAPKSYQAQNRAVTTGDYATLIPSKYPDVESISCWGGEDNIPPRYGKVFISLKPKSGYTLSMMQKEILKREIIKAYNVVSIEPVLVDPDYTHILLSTKVKYDHTKTSNSIATLKENITEAIQEYGNTELEKFNNILRYSRLTKLIDNTDQAILGNITNIIIQKRLSDIATNIPYNYDLQFGNPIYQKETGGSLTSTEFEYIDPANGNVVWATLEDDGKGGLRIISFSTGAKKIIISNAGNIDYKTGHVEILRFKPHIETSQLWVNVIPGKGGTSDIRPVRNQILTISEINVTVEKE